MANTISLKTRKLKVMYGVQRCKNTDDRYSQLIRGKLKILKHDTGEKHEKFSERTKLEMECTNERNYIDMETNQKEVDVSLSKYVWTTTIIDEKIKRNAGKSRPKTLFMK